MGKLVQAQYTLRDIPVVFTNGSTADLLEVQVEHSVNFEKRKPGASPVERQVITDQTAKITVKGFNSNKISSADLAPGTGIESFSLEDNGTSILPENFFKLFPIAKMCLGTTKYGLTDKPSEWETEIMVNVDNIAQYAESVAKATA